MGALDKIQPQGLEDIAPAVVTPWADGVAQPLGDILSRTICPDDLPGSTDAEKILAARDLVRTGVATRIQLLARTYSVNQVLDFTDTPNVEIVGAGAADYGVYATTIDWTGGAGGSAVFRVHGADNVQQNGFTMRHLAVTAQGASYGLDLHGIDRCVLDHVWVECDGTEVVRFRSIAGKDFINWSARHLDINALGTCIGWGWNSPNDGTSISDVCFGFADHVRIQHRGGTGFYQGASDTNIINQLLVQRISGAGESHIVGGGQSGSVSYDYAYANTIIAGYFTTPPRSLDTGRPGYNNKWLGMVGTSGSALPSFEGDAWGEWSVDDGQNYFKFEDGEIYYRDANCRVSMGRQFPATPRLGLSQATSGRLLDLYNGAAPSGGKWVSIDIDGNGYILVLRRDDTGTFVRNSLILPPEGQVRFPGLAAAPSSPLAGDVYYDNVLNKHRAYNGTWHDLY